MHIQSAMIIRGATDSTLAQRFSSDLLRPRAPDDDDDSMIQKMSALFAISLLSLFASAFPTLSMRISFVRIPPVVFFILKHFGTGVILSTAFVHLLQDAFEILLSREPNSSIGHWTGLIVLLSLCIIFLVEYVCMAYVENLEGSGAGHFHGHLTFLSEHCHPSCITSKSVSKDNPSHGIHRTLSHDRLNAAKPLSPLCESMAEGNAPTTTPITERTRLLSRTRSLTPHLISHSRNSSSTRTPAAPTTHNQHSVIVTHHPHPSAHTLHHQALCMTHAVEHAHRRDSQFFSGHHRYECPGIHASHIARARRTPSLEELTRPLTGASASTTAVTVAAPCDDLDCVSHCGSDERGRHHRHSRSRSRHSRRRGAPQNLVAVAGMADSCSFENRYDGSYQSEDEREVSGGTLRKIVNGSADNILPLLETPCRDAHDDHHDHHHEDESELAEDKLKRRRQIVSILVLQIGIMLHSLIIGLTLSIKNGSEFTSLFIAIMFHQLFEGLSLGVRLAALPDTAFFAPTLAILFAAAIPSGIVLGRITLSHGRSDPTTKRTQGIMSALSAGTLIYAGCVEMLAADLALDPQLKRSPLLRQLLALGSVIVGIAAMSSLA